MPLFPGVEANLLDGPVRWLYAPTTVAVPARDADVIDVIGPNYNPKTGWIDAGFTTEDNSEIDRDMDSDELRVDQRTGAILERITAVNRTFTIPFAEITPEIMKIAEEGAAIATVAAAGAAGVAGKGAGKRLDFGSFDSLTQYRWAAVARRDPGFGALVTELGNASATRGPFVCAFFHRAAIAADSSTMSIQKGELSNRQVQFTVYPETTITDPLKQHGSYWFENAPQSIPLT